jgi:hypothetical protein
LSGSLTEPFACGRFKNPFGLRIPPPLSGWNKGNQALLASKQAYSSQNLITSKMVRHPAWRSQPDRARRLARSIDLENAVKIEQGVPNPLSATWNGRGANFALFSAFLLEGATPLA